MPASISCRKLTAVTHNPWVADIADTGLLAAFEKPGFLLRFAVRLGVVSRRIRLRWPEDGVLTRVRTRWPADDGGRGGLFTVVVFNLFFI